MVAVFWAPDAQANACVAGNYSTCQIDKVRPADLDVGQALAAGRAKQLTASQIAFHFDAIENLMAFNRNAVLKALAGRGIRIKSLRTKRLSFRQGFLRSGWSRTIEAGSVRILKSFHGKGAFRIENEKITFTPRHVPPKQRIVERPGLGKIVTRDRVTVPVGQDDTYHVRFVGGTLGNVEGFGAIDGPISFVGGYPYIPAGSRMVVDDVVISGMNAAVLLCRGACDAIVRQTKTYAWFKKNGIEAQGRFSLRFTDVGYFDVLGEKEGYLYRRENDYFGIQIGNKTTAGVLKLRTGHNLIPEVSSGGFVRVTTGNNRFTLAGGVLRDLSSTGNGKLGSVPVTILASAKGRTVATVVGEARQPHRMSKSDYLEMTRLRQKVAFRLRGYFHKSVLKVFATGSAKWRKNHGFDLALIKMRDQYGKVFPVTIIEGVRASDGRGAEAPTGWPTDIYWFIKQMKQTSQPGSYNTLLGYIFSDQSATHEIFHTISQLDSRRVGRMDSGPLYQAFSRALSSRRGSSVQAPTSYGSDHEEWLAGTGAALIHNPAWGKRNAGRQAIVRPLLDHLRKYKNGELPIPIIDRRSGHMFAEGDFRRYDGEEQQQVPYELVVESQDTSQTSQFQAGNDAFDGFEN